MKLVIYVRYSSHSQTEQSIEGQLQYAKNNGYTVIGEYIDRAQSNTTDNRIEFQRMIADSDRHTFDGVLVYQLDRFARNRFDSAVNKAKLKKNGVRVLSARENITDDASGILVEGILESMAEYYSAELSQKIRRGMDINAEKCLSNGSNPGLGYSVDSERRFHVNPEIAPIVREIFEQYASGKTVMEIITDLNARQIKTSLGKAFNKNSLHRLLRNKRYIGYYIYKDTETPGGMPRILDDDLFERVQSMLDRNKKAPARKRGKDEYLLTTKLFCGHCGRMMIGESGKSHTGVIHRYYKCSGAKRKLGCHKKAVKKDWIERIAVQYTIQRVFQDELITQIADKLVELQNTEDNTLPLLRKQLADTNRGIENMLNAIQQGILTSSTKERLEELEKLQEELKTSILQAELEQPKYSREDIVEWISWFKYGDPNNKEYQRQIIDIFLNSIYVFDDRLVFTYNYKNGTLTVTLADVSAAFGSDLKSRTPPT
ncbi:recombinase family protein [Massiliimalia timonensis]|uniref:recombinase family protein n=1 Tax=Massiliimalia timonensis TaxID=1987501 RepID=UPI000B8B8961|nr:recombinase family protein [Massiliimalia timonensis]